MRLCPPARSLRFPRKSVFRRLSYWLVSMTLVFLPGCAGKPENVSPVSDFDIDRYLGRWYEICRLDHWFERGLTKVTAEYSVDSEGSIKVLNRGYSAETGTWKEAVGTAKFAGNPDQGFLQVSFFGPFYASYVIFDLDKEGYQYAFVSGKNTSYLWLLARAPRVSESVKIAFENRAGSLGFPVDKLIWLDQ